MEVFWLLTSTFYGNWLPGDSRGFVGRVHDRRESDPSSDSRLEHDQPGTDYDRELAGLCRASEDLMTQPAVRIGEEQAKLLLDQFQTTARIRNWRFLAAAIMSNHIHLIVGAHEDVDPVKILGDLKAYGSRALSGESGVKQKWWTSKGSTRKLPDLDSVARATRYVLEQAGALAVWSEPASGVALAPRVEREDS